MTTVSIITATLGRLSLQDACDSIDSQDFKGWHHYVVGDGVLPVDYSHPQRTTIGFSVPIGASQPALNMPEGTPNPILAWALQHLDLGEYVCFLDDDNIYKPNFLRTMAKVLSTHSNAGIVICAVENLRGEWQEIDGYPEYRRCDNSGFMVRSAIAKKIGFPPASPAKECVQDYEFIRACAEQYDWLRVSEELVVFGSSPNPPPGRGGIKILDSWSLPLRGARLVRSGNIKEGVRILAESIEIDREDAWALWHLGEALLLLGDLDKAIHFWNEWRSLLSQLTEWPNDWVHYCFALASYIAEDVDEAKKHLSNAIAEAEANQYDETILQIDNLFNLGLYLLLKSQTDEASKYYKKALKKCPDQMLIKEAVWNLRVLQVAFHNSNHIDEVIQLFSSHLE